MGAESKKLNKYNSDIGQILNKQKTTLYKVAFYSPSRGFSQHEEKVVRNKRVYTMRQEVLKLKSLFHTSPSQFDSTKLTECINLRLELKSSDVFYNTPQILFICNFFLERRHVTTTFFYFVKQFAISLCLKFFCREIT